MSKAMHSVELARSSAPKIDMCAIVPILGCVYGAIVAPLWFYDPDPQILKGLVESHSENRFFWPVMAVISIVLITRNVSRFRELALPTNIICLFAYFALAGASVLWAFKPEISFIRFAQQVMVLTSIVLPALIAARTPDMMRALFLCFAAASILNVFFVFQRPLSAGNNENFGYAGYMDKNSLGQFAAMAFLLALHEIIYPGLRRASGVVIIGITIWLLFVCKSKTSLALAFCVPVLAGLTLITGKMMRISSATVLVSALVFYDLFCRVSGFSMIRISYMIYGNPSFSGRTFIWDFVQYEISRRPFLGWGYQSFWLVGSDGPSFVDIGGWISLLQHAHNGYLDVMVETGRIGFTLFVIFIITTLYAIGRVANRDPARAWLLLSLALFTIFHNFLESSWTHGFHTLWLVFLIVAAQAARYSQPFPLIKAGVRTTVPEDRAVLAPHEVTKEPRHLRACRNRLTDA